jgi:hypothetical protein
MELICGKKKKKKKAKFAFTSLFQLCPEAGAVRSYQASENKLRLAPTYPFLARS